LGDAGSMNVQGEDVKKLDIFANNQFMGVLNTELVVLVLAAKNLTIL
jgi:fructose-1,6-bisphosphatase